MKIRIGPAGTGGNAIEGLKKISELGLDACEIEFTYGVRMTNVVAEKVGELAKRLGISLSVHAPYYINLNSEEKDKIDASKKRILDSCERLYYLGGEYVVFHAGFYGKDSKEKTYQDIKKEITDLQKTIRARHWNVVLAPETTGKNSQFGTVDELLRLKNEINCHLTIDFAHILARQNSIDYDELFKKIKNIGRIHSHFSGIEWTEKGERRHIITEEKDIKELLGYVKKYNVDITIINESPDPFGDSLKTKNVLGRLD